MKPTSIALLLLLFVACARAPEDCPSSADGTLPCGERAASWAFSHPARSREGLPIVVALSRAAIDADYYESFKRAGNWYNRRLQPITDGAPTFIVIPAVDVGEEGLEPGEPTPGDVYVEIGLPPHGKKGWADVAWDAETCGIGQVAIIVHPRLSREHRFGIAVHELGHALGVKHRAHSDAVTCEKRVCIDESECELLDEELADIEWALFGGPDVTPVQP